jgi:Zn-dependent M16 (insulinase) family peptidase
MLPDAKGYISLLQYLNGNNDEDRQRMRDEVLSTTVDDFRNFADVLEGVKESGLVKALGSKGAIEEAVRNHQLPLKIIEVM